MIRNSLNLSKLLKLRLQRNAYNELRLVRNTCIMNSGNKEIQIIMNSIKIELRLQRTPVITNSAYNEMKLRSRALRYNGS